MTTISAELLAYYDATDYIVQAPEGHFTVHIGQHSPELAALHARLAAQSSAMVTAYNPYSIARSFAANEVANQMLYADLALQQRRWIPAVGSDPGGTNPPEPGVLIPGISWDEAFALSKKYHQNAFVFAEADAIPRLGLCE
jgi:hypothetical protein